MKKVLLFVFFIQIVCLFAQEALKSTEEEYYDFLSLQGIVERPTLGYRTLSDSIWEIPENTEHVWQNNNLGSTKVLWQSEKQGNNWFTKGFFHGFKYKLFGPDWFNSFNTAAPYGQNDGALWQGRGYNTSLTAGARIEGYGFELTFKPMVTFSQNLGFDYLPGVYGDTHSYFWAGNIDLVQRFGDNPYFQFDWNDTEIRYSFYNFTIGFGTQSFWLGPAKLNPILGSNNSGGIPKFDIGLRKTNLIIPGLNWNLGKIESRIWIAQLSESDYFNNDGIKDKNLFNGFNISFSPSFWPDFTIGVTKICLTRWGNNFWMYLNPFYSSNDINGIGEDQKASIYFDITIPKVGFNMYAEFGLDDYTSNQLGNFFHTFISTFGFQQKFSISKEKMIKGLLFCELNFFEMSQDFQLQWNYMGFYAHHQIKEGYTQNGQIIGAGSGFFGNSQLIGFKIYIPRTELQLFYHRNVPDMNYLYNKAINNVASNIIQFYGIVESKHSFGICASFFINKSFHIKNEIDLTFIDDFLFIDKNSKTNFHFLLNLKYNF